MLDASQCPPTVTVEATLTPHHATDTDRDQHWQLGNMATVKFKFKCGQKQTKPNAERKVKHSNGNGNVMEIAADLAVDRSGIQHGSQVETFRVILAATQPCYLFCTFRFPPTATGPAHLATCRTSNLTNLITSSSSHRQPQAAAPPRDSHTQTPRDASRDAVRHAFYLRYARQCPKGLHKPVWHTFYAI